MSDLIAKRYRIISSLGQGGMADVYLAKDGILNREVAIKILRGDMATNPVALLRFQREANSSASLSHPNIVEVYDVGEEDGKHYIVMEYIDGDNLKQLISKRGALSKEEAVDIMKQLVSATACAHKEGIIHRDIKPQNVLMKADGTLKMADFGIAMAQDAVQLTQTDSVMGSVHYLAPELSRGEVATYQSDIYALGIVLYELLRGEPPFSGDAPVQIAMKHIREEMPSIRQFNSTIPQTLENVILKATAKNKNFRYRTAEEMLEDLSTCLDPKRAKEKKVEFELDDGNGKTIVIDQVARMENEDKKKSKTTWILAVSVTIIAVVALAGTLILNALSRQQQERYVSVPDILNHTVAEAKEILAEQGLDVNTSTIQYILTDDIEAGKIVSTLPEAGEEIEKGTKINLVVSEGIYIVAEDYVGMSFEEAKQRLSQYSKIKIVQLEEADPSVAPGTVLRQSGVMPNDKLDPTKRYEIVLTTAQYNTIVIPLNIIGMDVQSAIAHLESKGVEVVQNPLSTEGMSEAQLELLQRGVVVETMPMAGTSYTQSSGNYITISYYPTE